MIKAAIYDLDDTMVNSTKVHRQAWETLLLEYGHKVDELPTELRATFLGMRIIDILKIIAEYFSLPAEVEELFAKREKIFLDLAKKGLELLPGLKESIDFFRQNNLKIAIGSAATESYIDLFLNQSGLRNIIDIIVTGEDVTLGKPDPEVYLKAAEKLNLLPKECLVLEDATKGIQAAKGAGCYCLAIRNPYTLKQDLSQADLILDSLTEINFSVLKSLS